MTRSIVIKVMQQHKKKTFFSKNLRIVKENFHFWENKERTTQLANFFFNNNENCQPQNIHESKTSWEENNKKTKHATIHDH